jgi:hypothetical protein
MKKISKILIFLSKFLIRMMNMKIRMMKIIKIKEIIYQIMNKVMIQLAK